MLVELGLQLERDLFLLRASVSEGFLRHSHLALGRLQVGEDGVASLETRLVAELSLEIGGEVHIVRETASGSDSCCLHVPIDLEVDHVLVRGRDSTYASQGVSHVTTDDALVRVLLC